MDRWSALGRHGYGFPNSRCQSPSGSFPELPSCCHWVCFAKTWDSDSSGRPMLLGRNSCSRRGTSLGGWASGLRWTSMCRCFRQIGAQAHSLTLARSEQQLRREP
eukprot:2247313-Alexandrium_andersonii.AAC.1